MTERPPLSNYEIAIRAEMKKVIRIFYRYSDKERIAIAGCATRSNGNLKKLGDGGKYTYTHPDVKNSCFSTRKRAAIFALEQQKAAND